MADRTTRSASLRSNSRNPSSQNLPPISSFRVTRGKSREISDSDVRGRGPKRIKKNAGLASARSEDRVNSNVGKRAPRSTLLQGNRSQFSLASLEHRDEDSPVLYLTFTSSKPVPMSHCQRQADY